MTFQTFNHAIPKKSLSVFTQTLSECGGKFVHTKTPNPREIRDEDGQTHWEVDYGFETKEDRESHREKWRGYLKTLEKEQDAK
jgi:hypothetical protein